MNKNQAREFVEKLYNDDELMKRVLILAGAPDKIKSGAKPSEAQQYRDLAEVASKMGYYGTPEEFQEATKEYFEEIGSMESIRRVFRMVEIASNLVKEIM